MTDTDYLSAIFSEVNSKIENDHDKNVAPPMTKMSYPHDKNVAPPHDKNVIQTDQDITNIKNKEKETGFYFSIFLFSKITNQINISPRTRENAPEIHFVSEKVK